MVSSHKGRGGEGRGGLPSNDVSFWLWRSFSGGRGDLPSNDVSFWVFAGGSFTSQSDDVTCSFFDYGVRPRLPGCATALLQLIKRVARWLSNCRIAVLVCSPWRRLRQKNNYLELFFTSTWWVSLSNLHVINCHQLVCNAYLILIIACNDLSATKVARPRSCFSA
jgi:hypothetical protein